MTPAARADLETLAALRRAYAGVLVEFLADHARIGELTRELLEKEGR